MFSVSLKLPNFWPDSAKAWFAQTDAQFAIKPISSSETELYYWVSALSKDDGEQLGKLICVPLLSEPYETLNNRLFDLFEFYWVLPSLSPILSWYEALPHDE